MKIFASRPAIALAAAAVLTMAASPAMARGWRGHHRGHNRVDAGDVFAGLVIIGGIAAIAAAASKSNREKRERERQREYRYPDRDNRDSRDYRDYEQPSQRYGNRPDGSGSYTGSRRYGGSMDGAVDICANKVERGDRQIETIESVSRETDGWRVDGRISGGRDYSCIVNHDGQIRRVTVDGRAIL